MGRLFSMALAVGLAWSTQADAGTVSWTTTTGSTQTGTTTGCYDAVKCGYTWSNGAGSLLVRGYSTSAPATGVGSIGSLNGSWLQAQLFVYGSSGIGTKNALAGTGAGKDTNEGNSPEHSVDSEQVVDLLVFKLPTLANTTWSFNSLSLGWIASGSTGADTSPEINVWIGGNSTDYDFRDVCFQGCSAGDKTLTGAGPGGLGFSYVGRADFSGTGSSVIDGKDTGSASSPFATQNVGATGQYIVIAASTTAGNPIYDAFKVKGLSVNQLNVPPPPPSTSSVPEPGSIALLLGGALGLALVRRRRT